MLGLHLKLLELRHAVGAKADEHLDVDAVTDLHTRMHEVDRGRARQRNAGKGVQGLTFCGESAEEVSALSVVLLSSLLAAPKSAS